MTGLSPALVLSGGNALGAYHAGAWGALEERGVAPGWLVGASIGAITAALVCGNPPGQRMAALDQFWSRASVPDMAAFLPAALRQPVQYSHALASRLFGRLPLFNLRLPDLTGRDARSSLFDTTPMRNMLEELVDVERMNAGEMRLTVLAVDLVSGEEVVFDTHRQRVEIDQIMASAALIPDFAPVNVEGRLLVDGGLSANLPLHLVLEELLERDERFACFALDLFPSAAPPPRGLLQVAQRQNDLVFASQTTRALRAMTRLWDGHAPGADLFLSQYQALEDETAIKSFDFSAGTLARRRQAGQLDMRTLLDRWAAAAPARDGLTVHLSSAAG